MNRHRIAIVLSIFTFAIIAVFSQFAINSQAAGETVRERTIVELSANNGFTAATAVSVPADSRLLRFQSGRELQMDAVLGELRAEGIDVSAATPLSLTSDDLDGDGYPDLVCGYGTGQSGFLVIYYGNESAYSPSDENILRGIREETRFPMPFASARIVRLDAAPDILATGDLDRDGRKDIVSATRGVSAIEFIGNVEGRNTRPSERITVPGPVTAISTGQFGVGDAYADLAVAVGGDPALLLYTSNESILTAQPEVRPLPEAATSIAGGYFDAIDGEDLAVAAGSRIFVISSRSNAIETIEMPSRVREIAVGEFVSDRESRPEIAATSDDGTMSILTKGRLDTRAFTELEIRAKRQQLVRIRNGEEQSPAVKKASGNWRISETSASGGTMVKSARISTEPSDDLIVAGGVGIDVLTREGTKDRDSMRLTSNAETIAVLPMRLSVMGIPGLVLLQKGKIEPVLIMAAPLATFAVDTATDNAALTACTAAANDCSLRGAIIASNANGVGADSITFNAGINPTLTITSGGNAENAAATGDLDVNGSLTITGNAPTTLTTTYTSTCGDCKLFGMDQTGLFPGISVSIAGMNMFGGYNNGAAFCGTFFETGGGIDFFLQNTGNVFSLSGSTVNSNIVLGCVDNSHGGGVNIDSVNAGTPAGASAGTATLTNNIISNNSSLRDGGGIGAYADKHDVTMIGNTVDNNTVTASGSSGGGIYIQHAWGGTVSINGGSVSTNNASSGGGIRINGSENVNVGNTTAVTISNNTANGASGLGGGIYIGNSGAAGVAVSTTITNGTISTNHADGASAAGGGVYFLSAYNATISGTTISNNTATTGAGIANGGAGSSSTLTVNSSAIVSGNTATGAGGGLLNSNATSITNLSGMSFSGNAASSGTGISQSAGTINFSGTNNLNSNDSATLTGGATNVAGTLSINGSLTIAGGTFAAGSSTVNLAKDFVFSSGTFTPATSTFNFNGTSAQQISGGTVPTFNILTVSNTTAALAVNNNATVNGNLTINANAVLQPAAASIIGGPGTLTGNGTARVTRTAATADFLTQYTITNKTLTNLTVEYAGAAAQSVNALTYGGLRLNNASGATLAGPTTVNGALTLTNGILATGANTLTVGGTGTSARTSGYVSGNLSKIFTSTGTFLYPVGTASGYSPFTPNVTTLTTNPSTLRVTAVGTRNTNPSTPLDAINRYWDLTLTGALTADLTFQYLESDLPVGNIESGYTAIRDNGTIFRFPIDCSGSPAVGTACVNAATNIITVKGASTFSQWFAGRLLGPTAANASIAGRVVASDGRSIAGVRVVVSDQAGNTRTAISSAFGFYLVDELAAGQTYVVATQSKRHTFAPRSITLSDSAQGFDLTAEP